MTLLDRTTAHLSNRQINIHCSLLRENIGNFDYLVMVHFKLPALKTNVGTRAAQTRWNSLVVSVMSAGNIIHCLRHLRTHFVALADHP